jgi:hygromycin-B 7''-O-kinase
MVDIDYWRPVIHAICAEHQLPLRGLPQIGEAGSHAVFLCGAFVVKIYAAPWRLWFDREVECLQVLEERPEAKAPRLLAFGRAAGGDDQHPYLVMQRLPGEPMSLVWDTLSLGERCELAAQAGAVVRALHSTPVERLRAFSHSPAHWVRQMQARAARCAEFLHLYGLTPLALPTLTTYLHTNLYDLRADFEPRLLNADLHGDHLLVERQRGRWCVTGLIDFGDAEVGPVEYEWIALCLDALRSEPSVLGAFFSGYGWRLPIPETVRQRLKLYTLLHRYPRLQPYARAVGERADLSSLDAYLESLWTL